MAAEEKALRSIEEMSQVGALQGVYGRLRDLIKIDRSFKKAMEAAAVGWLDALVVKDIDSAFTMHRNAAKNETGKSQNYPTPRDN